MIDEVPLKYWESLNSNAFTSVFSLLSKVTVRIGDTSAYCKTYGDETAQSANPVLPLIRSCSSGNPDHFAVPCPISDNPNQTQKAEGALDPSGHGKLLQRFEKFKQGELV